MGEDHSTQEVMEMVKDEKIMNHHKNNNISHFVLIHGAGGGAWCWYKIKTLMEISGYRVTCLDLKGAGIDLTDPNTILKFEDYNKPLIDFLSSLPENEQVILVGHSAGGISLSDAINKFGCKKIKLAIFLAATMLKLGFLTEEDIKYGVPHSSGSNFGELHEIYDFGFGLGSDHPPTSIIIKNELVRKIMYQMSPQEDLALIEMLNRPAPVHALTSTRFEEGDDVDKVPRIYIKTTHDRVLKPWQQNAMIKKWPPLDVYVLESDHGPLFSSPFLLFGLLIKALVSLGLESCV